MDSKADILENQEWKVFKFCGEGGVFDLRSTSSGLDFDKSDISKKEVHILLELLTIMDGRLKYH